MPRPVATSPTVPRTRLSGLFLLLACGLAGGCEAEEPSEQASYDIEEPVPALPPADTMMVDTMMVDSTAYPPPPAAAAPPEAWAEIAVSAEPVGAQVYLVPLWMWERDPAIVDGLTPASPYWVGTVGSDPLVVEERERSFMLVVKNGSTIQRREVRFQAGRLDTIRITLTGEGR